jgi:uncharacterized membrane protein YsdA (DUF1294 family)
VRDPFSYLAIGVALLCYLGARLDPLLSWLVGANVTAFAAYGIDKYLAKKRKRRISEADLFFYTLIGGTLGAWSGMKFFRHKTRKASFRRSFGIIVGVQVQLVGGYVWFRWFR